MGGTKSQLRQKAPLSQSKSPELDGYVRLQAAIIEQAVRDLRDPRSAMHTRRSAKAFLESARFRGMCDMIDIDPEAVTERLKAALSAIKIATLT